MQKQKYKKFWHQNDRKADSHYSKIVYYFKLTYLIVYYFKLTLTYRTALSITRKA